MCPVSVGSCHSEGPELEEFVLLGRLFLILGLFPAIPYLGPPECGRSIPSMWVGTRVQCFPLLPFCLALFSWRPHSSSDPKAVEICSSNMIHDVWLSHLSWFQSSREEFVHHWLFHSRCFLLSCERKCTCCDITKRVVGLLYFLHNCMTTIWL